MFLERLHLKGSLKLTILIASPVQKVFFTASVLTLHCLRQCKTVGVNNRLTKKLKAKAGRWVPKEFETLQHFNQSGLTCACRALCTCSERPKRALSSRLWLTLRLYENRKKRLSCQLPAWAMKVLPNLWTVPEQIREILVPGI